MPKYLNESGLQYVIDQFKESSGVKNIIVSEGNEPDIRLYLSNNILIRFAHMETGTGTWSAASGTGLNYYQGNITVNTFSAIYGATMTIDTVGTNIGLTGSITPINATNLRYVVWKTSTSSVTLTFNVIIWGLAN